LIRYFAEMDGVGRKSAGLTEQSSAQSGKQSKMARITERISASEQPGKVV